jgi:protein O-GlcNAc transferase
MTGLMADRFVIPEDRQHEHVEKIVYLPSVIDYDGTEGLPDPNPLPCLTERPTFGVFQRSLKLNAEDIGVWQRLLERMPESRLLMKSFYCPSLTRWIQAHFEAQWSQVEIQGATSSFDHKMAYQQVDLCLDPWPQTGGVSACDALWMGVPAVTLVGPRVIQRTTASLLTSLGLPEFIAETHEDYIAKAVEWVTVRREELAGIRLGLRELFRASPIHAGYVEEVEVQFRNLWQAWCATPVSIADARKRLELAMAS